MSAIRPEDEAYTRAELLADNRRMMADLVARDDEITALKSIAKYAEHKESCEANHGPDGTKCTCGLDAARRALDEAGGRIA